MLRLSPVVRNLIFINVVVFVLQKLLPGPTAWLALYNVQTELFKPFQLFTYMFCHGGLGHIFFNMLMLVFFGPILEEFWGQKKFLIFYMVAGIGAGVFNILIDLTLHVGTFYSMIGASGACYGVLTAFGIIFPNMELRLLLLPIAIKAKYMVLILGSIAIFSGFRQDPGDNTAHLAHLGGIVVAMIFLQVSKNRGGY